MTLKSENGIIIEGGSCITCMGDGELGDAPMVGLAHSSFDQEHLVAACELLDGHVESQGAVAGDVDSLNDEL